jgi:hypothetical protein
VDQLELGIGKEKVAHPPARLPAGNKKKLVTLMATALLAVVEDDRGEDTEGGDDEG